MPKEILLPVVTTDFEGGAIEEWLKGVGDMVKVGEPLVEVATEKAVVEVEAEVSGTIGKILVPAGTADVAVNTPIAILLLDGEDASALDGWSEASDVAASADVKAEEAVPSVSPTSSPSAKASGGARRIRMYASPIARRIAEKIGLDLDTIAGSGPRGRIVLGDVEAAADRQGLNLNGETLAVAVNQTESIPDGDYTLEPADNIRQVIARRLTEAKQNIPHFYLTVDCSLDRLLDTRRQINEFTDATNKVSVNDFFVKACALSLKEVPRVNASWADTAIQYFNDVNISLAVASPKGLMTPVLRHADRKSLSAISDAAKDLASRARAGKLKPDEFKGGGFTISNLGMYGVREFSAIINPPQACILAIGMGEQRAVVRNGNVVIESMVTCTLSVDHRAVDGALGAEFLQVLKKYIERPVTLIS